MISGGSRSFSISLFRLKQSAALLAKRSTMSEVRHIEVLDSLNRDGASWKKKEEEGEETYASSNPWIASLIPSAPEASAPAGKAFVPFKLLSSETRSDSSLYNVSFCQNTHRRGLPK